MELEQKWNLKDASDARNETDSDEHQTSKIESNEDVREYFLSEKRKTNEC